MTTRFSVDARELRMLALQCFTLRGELAEQALPRDELQGISGDRDVEHAYGEFIEHWTDGLAEARSHVEALALRLSEAADAYTAVENAVERAAGGAPGRAGTTAAPGTCR
jgi:hypothetical protein